MEKEKGAEEEVEEEDDGQLDTIYSPPPEDDVSGILEVGPGVSSGDIPGEFGAIISCQWLYGQVG